jgi:photosystem II stability/assembly factor-like uncharacterized protein
MKKSTPYPEHFSIKYTRLIFMVVFLLATLQSCKKDHDNPAPPTPIPPPLAMQVISGNNQMGFPYRALMDTIIIKITPKNANDRKGYSYNLDYSTGSNPQHFVSGSNDDYIIRIIWTMSGDAVGVQRLKVRLYGNCPNPYDNSCQALDSVEVMATVNNRPWVKVFGNTSSGNFRDMYFTDAMNGIAVSDFNTGLAATSDGGVTWNFVNNGRLDFYELEFCNKDTGLAVQNNTYAYFTNDGGKSFQSATWTPPITGPASSLDFCMVNRDVIYAVGSLGKITKTVDGGKNWTTYAGFNFINRMRSVTCPSANTCYACGEAAKIVKTNDGGNSWREQQVLLNNNLQKVYFIDDNFGFAAGQYGALVRTTDGGNNWTVIPTRLTFDIIEIRFFNRNLGFIVSYYGEIAKTTDGGLTWKLIVGSGYGISGLNKAFIKDSTVAFALQNQYIFKYDLQ